MVALPLVLNLFPIRAVVKSINKYPDKVGNEKDAKGVKNHCLLHLQSDDLTGSVDIKWSI